MTTEQVHLNSGECVSLNCVYKVVLLKIPLMHHPTHLIRVKWVVKAQRMIHRARTVLVQIWMPILLLWAVAALYHLIVFVFPLLKPVNIGIQILWTYFLNMETFFMLKALTKSALQSMIYQQAFRFMMQIFVFNLIYRNKVNCAAHLRQANKNSRR